MHQVVLRTYYHYAYAKTLSQLITVFLYGVFQFVIMEMNNQTGVETYQVFYIYFVSTCFIFQQIVPEKCGLKGGPVSYTHLTLPTKA